MTPSAAWLLAGAAGLAGFVILGLLDPATGTAPPFCLVRLVLDLPCPGCGMTRALHALARGDFAGAIHFHPFAPALAAQAALLWVWWGIRIRTQPGRHQVGAAAPAANWLGLLYGNGAVLLALWAGRLAAGSLPR